MRSVAFPCFSFPSLIFPSADEELLCIHSSSTGRYRMFIRAAGSAGIESLSLSERAPRLCFYGALYARASWDILLHDSNNFCEESNFVLFFLWLGAWVSLRVIQPTVLWKFIPGRGVLLVCEWSILSSITPFYVIWCFIMLRWISNQRDALSGLLIHG